jgi:hypothetical protein
MVDLMSLDPSNVLCRFLAPVTLQIKHFPWDFLILNHVKIVLLLPNLVRVSERRAHHPLVPSLKGNDMFS